MLSSHTSTLKPRLLKALEVSLWRGSSVIIMRSVLFASAAFCFQRLPYLYGRHGLVAFCCFWPFLAVTVSSASIVFRRHALVRFCCFWRSWSRPLLLFLAVTVCSASTVCGCHGLVRFYCYWLSRYRPLVLFFAVTVSSASTVCGCFRSRPLLLSLAVTVSSASTVIGRHGLVRFYCFWLSRPRPLLLFCCHSLVRFYLQFFAVTVSSASVIFGCHGLVRFYCFWLSRFRPLLLFLAVTVSSASIFLAVTVFIFLAVTVSSASYCLWLSASIVLGCHGLVRFYCFAVTVSSATTVLRSRSGPLLLFLALTVSSASTVFGCHGLVRFDCLWLSRSRPLLVLLAALVAALCPSKASTSNSFAQVQRRHCTVSWQKRFEWCCFRAWFSGVTMRRLRLWL